MTAPDSAVCPTHPYGYHRASRVNPEGAKQILRHHSPIGLPRRCFILEEELLDADREIEFQEELAVFERTPAPVRALLMPFGVAVLLLLVLAVDSAAIAVPIGALTALVIERTGAQVQRERLRRIVDWRRRVGR